MNAPLIAPLIPPRGRSGSREHGRAALHGEFADAELLAHVGAGPGRRQSESSDSWRAAIRVP
jgi:hypothetical protein